MHHHEDNMGQSVRLTPGNLIAAYSRGLFPMADERGVVNWYECEPRAVLPIDGFHVPRRLARTVRSKWFEVRVDHAFESVIAGCARPAPGRQTTWISDEIIEAFCRLHKLGLAHSVETWRDEKLVGGIYGVALGGLFAGESMFHLERDAGKVALVHLVDILKGAGFCLFDIQYIVNDNFKQFGVLEISRDDYLSRLETALEKKTDFSAIRA